jgi:radical SAM protein with 4Fe4S-binding SPASM domain
MANVTIPQISYRDFRLSLGGRTAEIRYPYHGTIEITPHCNLKCVHCYVRHCQQKEQILSAKQWYRIIDEFAAEGCLWLIMTGGEPLSHPDFLDIYTHVKKKGIYITLFTNATLITPEIADFIRDWPPLLVEVTLYGGTKETYEKVTGVSGSYERCLQGIELLVERHIQPNLKAVAMTLNKDEIHIMENYAKKLGLSFRWDASIMPRIDHGLEPHQYRLTPEEVMKMEMEYPERLEGWQDFCQTYVGTRPSELLYLCGAGKHSFTIDSSGHLLLCLSGRSQRYDLRRGSFNEGWNTFLPSILSQKASPTNKCHSCELLPLCGCCPNIAELETGDLQSSVDWLCRLAHLRMERFGHGDPVQKK